MKTSLRQWIGLAASYTFIFVLFSWPSILKMGSHVLADSGDGLVYVWNLWWVNKAIVELHQSPGYTPFLHFPDGVSLIPHAMCLYKGLLSILLRPIFNLAQTYNLLLIFSFVATGLTTYALAFKLTRRPLTSWMAGALVTFSNYHFAHAQGHLQVVSFEAVPVFLLCGIYLVESPSIKWAIATAAALLVVLWSDYYYFFYCALAAVLFLLFRDRKKLLPLTRKSIEAWSLFVGLALLMTAPIYQGMQRLTQSGAPGGVHTPEIYSLDVISPFAPGPHWRWAHLTQDVWMPWRAGPHESSVYLGWSVLFLFGYVLWKKIWIPHQKVWYAFLVVFFIFALGPALHVSGQVFTGIPLPYKALEALIPPLKLSGTPVRMISMVILALALLAGKGFDHWWNAPRRSRLAKAFLVFLLLFEYWPAPLPATELRVPDAIRVLRDAPPGAVIDTVTDRMWALYFQTVHEKPMALGYISRTPARARQQGERLMELYRKGDFKALAGEGFRYLLIPADEATAPVFRSFRVLSQGPVYLLEIPL